MPTLKRNLVAGPEIAAKTMQQDLGSKCVSENAGKETPYYSVRRSMDFTSSATKLSETAPALTSEIGLLLNTVKLPVAENHDGPKVVTALLGSPPA